MGPETNVIEGLPGWAKIAAVIGVPAFLFLVFMVGIYLMLTKILPRISDKQLEFFQQLLKQIETMQAQNLAQTSALVEKFSDQLGVIQTRHHEEMDLERAHHREELDVERKSRKDDFHTLRDALTAPIAKLTMVIDDLLKKLTATNGAGCWAVILVFAACSIAQAADTLSAVVTRCHDGDTPYDVKDGAEIARRLHWADTPEARAPWWPAQPGWAEALAFTQDALLRRKVTYTFDEGAGASYDRPVVSISYIDDKGKQHDLATELVKRGLAACDPRYQPPAKLLNEQAKAQAKGVGMWALKNPVMPWDWRKGAR